MPEVPFGTSEDLSAIRAGALDSDAATGQPVMLTDAPPTAAIAAAGRDGETPRLNAKARRRLSRLQKVAHLRNALEPTRPGVAA